MSVSGLRRPVTFKLDDPHVVVLEPDEAASRPARGSISITPEAEPEPEPVFLPELPEMPPVPARKGFRWGVLFWSSLAGLILLGTVLGAIDLVGDLFARSEGLGFLGLMLAALFVIASIAIAAREIAGLTRLATIENLHRRSAGRNRGRRSQGSRCGRPRSGEARPRRSALGAGAGNVAEPRH